MAFEGIFKSQFESSVDRALTAGAGISAFVEGCKYGVASGHIYLAEALLFFVGAVLISRGFKSSPNDGSIEFGCIFGYYWITTYGF